MIDVKNIPLDKSFKCAKTGRPFAALWATCLGIGVVRTAVLSCKDRQPMQKIRTVTVRERKNMRIYAIAKAIGMTWFLE